MLVSKKGKSVNVEVNGKVEEFKYLDSRIDEKFGN